MMQYPKRVTIELTNHCNRACDGCPRHKMTYPLGDMNPELFSKIITELPENTVIVPFFRGEPTLHPQFAEYMQQLGKFKTVQLATNGDYLNKTNQKAILNNASFLSISLHDFRLPNRTNYLPFLYDCLGKGLETQVSILETSLKDSQVKHFKRMWLKHVNRVRIYKEHSKNGFGSMNIKATNQPCNKPFEDMIVYWDGKVGLCNHDWNGLSIPAYMNLNDYTVKEVWNSMHYDDVRVRHVQGERRFVPTCRDCDFNSNKIYGEIINAHS